MDNYGTQQQPLRHKKIHLVSKHHLDMSYQQVSLMNSTINFSFTLTTYMVKFVTKLFCNKIIIQNATFAWKIFCITFFFYYLTFKIKSCQEFFSVCESFTWMTHLCVCRWQEFMWVFFHTLTSLFPHRHQHKCKDGSTKVVSHIWTGC